MQAMGLPGWYLTIQRMGTRWPSRKAGAPKVFRQAKRA